MKISVNVFQVENQFVANCPELEINCYGSSFDEARSRIKKVITFYVDSAKELGMDVEEFDKIVIEGQESELSKDSFSSCLCSSGVLN